MSAAAYAIGDLARQTGTKVETIRWYERVGLLAAPARTAGNYRTYGEPHLGRLSFIRRARDLGFSLEQIRTLLDLAEDRERFQKLVNDLGLRQPPNRTARTEEDALTLAREIGYPLVVRPSYVLGGRAMEIVYGEADLARYMRDAVKVSNDSPVLLDHFLDAAVEADARQFEEHMLDRIDVPGDEQSKQGAHPRADQAQQQSVTEEDLHDAAVAGSERFQDADVARLFADDHREDRQDAESGHADDHEQQQVQQPPLDLDGREERALLLLPRVDLVLVFVPFAGPEFA